ncbi:MAG: glycosyltransferase family 4 protein, partial [Gemmobacter sp.]
MTGGLRIVHLLPCLYRGGAEANTLRLIRALEGRHRFVMVAPDGPGAALFDGVLPRRAFRRLEADVLAGFASVRRALAAELAAGPVDIVHVHVESALLWFARRAMPEAARVFTSHGIVGAATVKYRATALTTNRWAHRTTVVSAHDFGRMLRAGADPGRLRLVQNGVARPAATPGGAAALRARLGLREGDVVVGTLARLEPEKGVDVLVRAAARVPGVSFVVAGEGGQRAALARLIARTGAPVRLAGFVAAGDLLDLCDIYVQPSRAEAFGLGVAEAMAAGRPVIASRAGGLPELVAEGETGLLVPPGDPAALAAAIGRLAGDGGLRAAMG